MTDMRMKDSHVNYIGEERANLEAGNAHAWNRFVQRYPFEGYTKFGTSYYVLHGPFFARVWAGLGRRGYRSVNQNS